MAAAWGCASAPKAAAVFVAPSWPAPPLPPRVTFVQEFSDQQSMGPVKRGAAEAFLAYLAGKQPPSDHLYQPMDIDVTDDGQRVYIADFGQMTVFLVDHVAKTLGPLPHAFERPFGLGLDSDANIYVSEQEGRRITVLSPAFKTLRVITHESLVRPSGIAIDRARGLLYVADPSRGDSKDHSVKVFDLSGTLVRTLGAGRGNCEGCLLFPTFVAVDSKGQVYVSNTLNARIDVFDAEGKYVRHIGERGNAYGMFDKPKGVAVDTYDNVYVVDSGWANVQIFNQAGDTLLFFGGRGTNPGLLNNPTGIAIDKQNRIYVADFLNYRVASYQLVNTKAADSDRPPGDQAAPGAKVP
jgi:DNA-binding beta-propeller fold protein YncE